MRHEENLLFESLYISRVLLFALGLIALVFAPLAIADDDDDDDRRKKRPGTAGTWYNPDFPVASNLGRTEI